MRIATPQAPTFNATGEAQRGAIDEVFALLHEVGLEIDAQQDKDLQSPLLSETEVLVARIAEQLQALKEQRARLAELIDSIGFAGA